MAAIAELVDWVRMAETTKSQRVELEGIANRLLWWVWLDGDGDGDYTDGLPT